MPNVTRVIDVLTYPAVQLLDVTGPIQVFASANDHVTMTGGVQPYALRVVAQGGQGVTASAGLAFAADPLTPIGEALDTLLVAGGEHPGINSDCVGDVDPPHDGHGLLWETIVWI
jgi:transcriptional regulator GlxA family with amidase domain